MLPQGHGIGIAVAGESADSGSRLQLSSIRAMHSLGDKTTGLMRLSHYTATERMADDVIRSPTCRSEEGGEAAPERRHVPKGKASQQPQQSSSYTPLSGLASTQILTFRQIAERHAVNLQEIIQPNLPTIPELHVLHTGFAEYVDDLVIGLA